MRRSRWYRPPTLRAKILLYLLAIHGLMAAVAVLALHDRPALLALAEVLFVVSVVLGARLVRAFFVPLDLIHTGAELIGEQDFSSTLRPVGHPEMDALIEVYNRMLARLRDERLRQQEQNFLLDSILRASPAAILTLDFDGRVSLANPRAETLLGAPGVGLAGNPLIDLRPLGKDLTALPVGSSQVFTLGGGRRLKGARAEFFDRGFARSLFVLEELTEELRASEKAAYGQLIRMLSHEVNNSVGAVGSLLDSLRSYAPVLDEEPRREFLDAVAVSIQRLERLRAFMHGFADIVRLPVPERRACDLVGMLEDLRILLRPQLLERHIACTFALDDNPSPTVLVEIDRNQIEQVLVNVFKNGLEAIDENGTIAIALRHEPPGPRPVLRIRDSGPGVSDEARGLLFSPFFTTKRDGRGLGLTLVREVLQAHGLAFGLDNRADGPGAEFWVRF